MAAVAEPETPTLIAVSDDEPVGGACVTEGESRVVEFPPNPLDIRYSLDF